MNTDIRVKINFKGHRKRRKLRKILGPNYLDYLMDIWLTAADEKPDGNLGGWDDDDLVSIASATVPYKGTADKLRGSLIEAGFLETTMDLHDWAEHQNWVVDAPNRQAKAKHASTVKKIKKEYYKECSGHYSEDNSEECSEECPLKSSKVCPFDPPSNPPFLLPSFSFPSPFLLLSHPNGNNTPYRSPSRGTKKVGNNGDEFFIVYCEECNYELEWRFALHPIHKAVRTQCPNCEKSQVFRLTKKVEIE